VKIRYTRKALAQLDQVYLFIEAHNPHAAKRVNARIKRAIDRLSALKTPRTISISVYRWR
jgi:plasmid stabilization system protein ParE